MKTIDGILIQDKENYGDYVKFEKILDDDNEVMVSFLQNDKPTGNCVLIKVSGLLKWLMAQYGENDK